MFTVYFMNTAMIDNSIVIVNLALIYYQKCYNVARDNIQFINIMHSLED